MPCYHPLKAFELGVKPNGKKDLKITSYKTHHLEIYSNKKIYEAPGVERSPFAHRVITDYVLIPCGQCLGCRIDYSRSWADRMMLELPYHKASSFVTLTYDDEHVPKSQYSDCVTGELCTSYTLRKVDYQLFMKRLRKHFCGEIIRFYACGEYGSESHRPHYHAILFGVCFPDLELKFRRDGINYFTSETLRKLWPYGHSIITSVTWETCAYVARYVTKKLTGPKSEFYTFFNLEPEFALMSRRPGLAAAYYDDHKSVMVDCYEINLSLPEGGRRIRPPHYYDSKFDIEYPDEFDVIKANRRTMARNMVDLKLMNTSLSYLEMLAVEEYNFKHKVDKLKRGDM